MRSKPEVGGLLHTYSQASGRCAAMLPNRLIESSTTSDWTALLLDHHEGSGHSDTFETHPTDDLTLVVATAGRYDLQLLAGGRWRTALYQPGNAGMTPPGETARLRWSTPSARHAYGTLHLYLPGSLLEQIADEYRCSTKSVVLSQSTVLAFRDDTVTVQAHALLAAHRNGEPNLYAEGAARWLATHLLSRQAQWRNVADDTRLAATLSDRRLARVIEFMSCHLDSALTLDELAREACISVHHFGRRFREHVGMGPAAYLTTLRIERACLLLRTTDLAVIDIAFRCGYSRASAFSTAFLRHKGHTPSAFRAER